ncbi:TetR/AcrR family transcriptional regulator [Streptomyces sp. NPDC046977]|uniref:TetR/AcrR family transcriptional regulator n=1 Tax=Streptomyces sp. NPDC046977 TaxID=3154703 RepID=UPI0033DEC885
MTPRQTRSDAVANRDRILAVAREAFADARDTSLTAIARQAGVGIGTLYRHFPTREALVIELYRRDIQQVIDRAPALLATRPPLEALRAWFEEVAHYGRLKYGIAEVVHAVTDGGLDDPFYDPFVHAIGMLLDAGAAEGRLKAGLDPEDVLFQLSVLWKINPAKYTDARASRLLDLIIDGLRVPAAGSNH